MEFFLMDGGTVVTKDQGGESPLNKVKSDDTLKINTEV